MFLLRCCRIRKIQLRGLAVKLGRTRRLHTHHMWTSGRKSIESKMSDLILPCYLLMLLVQIFKISTRPKYVHKNYQNKTTYTILLNLVFLIKLNSTKCIQTKKNHTTATLSMCYTRNLYKNCKVSFVSNYNPFHAARHQFVT